MTTLTTEQAITKMEKSYRRGLNMCEAHRKHLYFKVYNDLVDGGMDSSRAIGRVSRCMSAYTAKQLKKHSKRCARYILQTK